MKVTATDQLISNIMKRDIAQYSSLLNNDLFTGNFVFIFFVFYQFIHPVIKLILNETGPNVFSP